MIKQTILFFLILSSTVLYGQKRVYTLLECLSIANEKNIAIKQALLDLENARLLQEQAKGNFLPNINAQVNHSWNIGLNQNITTGILENITTQFSSAGLSLNTDIYNGGRKFLELYQSNLNILAQQYQLDNIKDNISVFVANAYLQVMLNRELLEVSELQLQLSEQELDRTSNLIAAGVLVASETYEIEANIASQEQAIIEAENNLRISRISLAQLLLITDYENFDIGNEEFIVPFSDILDQNPKDIYEEAVQTRANIKLSKANVDLAASSLEISKTSLLPSLSAFYSYNTRISYSDRLVESANILERPIGFVKETGQQVVSEFNDREVVGPKPFFDQWGLNDGHNFGLRLSVPVLNGKIAKTNVERNLLNLEKAEQQFEQDKLDFESTINQAYNTALGAYRLYVASQKTEISRKNAYDVAQDRYNAGVLNSYELVQAQQRYEIATSDVIRAKFSYIFQLKLLELYFGLPLNIDDILEE